MSHTSVSSVEMQLSGLGARLCLSESLLLGTCAHGPTTTGPDTHCGERLFPHHGSAGELSPRQSQGVGACQTPAPLQSGSCTPCCRGSCATVGHQGGKRWQHWVLPCGSARWQLSPMHCLHELPGWPHRQGAGQGDAQTALQE